MNWKNFELLVRRSYKRAAIVSFAAIAFTFSVGTGPVLAQAITEGFDVVPVAGWSEQNLSTPLGLGTWFQGNPVDNGDPDNPGPFDAQAGASTDSYIGCNFQSGTGTATLSNWLFVPNRTFKNGDVIKFWSRTVDTPAFPDRLEVRLSQSGSSVNVGTTATSVGDFTTVLLTINSGQTVTGYPNVWTQYTITLAGLPAAGVSGRIAFRYFVTNGGPNGARSDYIGIDTFSYTPVVTTAASVDLSGRVLTSEGRGVRNAAVTVQGQDGNSRTVATGPDGEFLFADVESGESYIVTVQSRRFTYAPRLVQVNDSISDMVFTPTSTPTNRAR